MCHVYMHMFVKFQNTGLQVLIYQNKERRDPPLYDFLKQLKFLLVIGCTEAEIDN